MDTDKTMTERLFTALKRLNTAMNNDGTAFKIGLKAFLIKNDCSYTHETSKLLYARGYVGKTQEKGSRSPLIFWNLNAPPSMALCIEVIKDVREIKRKKAAKRTAKKTSEKAPILTRAEILRELRGEALDRRNEIKNQLKALKKEMRANEFYIESLTQKMNNHDTKKSD